MVVEERLEGLGGWLILVALGIIVSPLRIIFELFPLYSDIFTNGYWEILTTSGTDAYHAMWAPILLEEMGINLALIFAWLYTIFLFFSKKRAFPKWYIGIVLFTLIFIVVDAIAIKSVLPDEPIFDSDTVKEISRMLISCLIWIPYMLISKRVAATFVRQ